MTDTPAVPAVPEPAAPVRSPESDHLNLLWKLARLTTNSEMVPRVLRGRPDAALAVMVYGAELSLRPMTALREIFIIEGTPSCSAKLMRALILRAGHDLRIEEMTRERCVLFGERADGHGSARVTWDMEDARIAGVSGKDNWRRYPRSMLLARATSELARAIFPDTCIGYTPEELTRTDLSGDYDYVDVEDIATSDDPAERPAYDVAADMLDAEDALDAEWLAEARGDTDEGGDDDVDD